MKTIFISILMTAIVLSGFRFFLASDTTGLYKDTKTIRDLSHDTIQKNLAPAP
ncbi:hypothetical protein [Bacillus sp. FJAT-27264]|uniref:hypothetical protein n=1 Tax=Paenibacillus sp. (strain DSM 101736 / FJAT-27264) TaxID=1850362 RepID=UPI001586B4CA|nr:hypothetical protein [Bacillus sp. FJAT-27264]